MRRIFFIFFILICAASGVLAALDQVVGVKLVLGTVGAVAGAAIGGAIASIGRRHHRAVPHSDEWDGFPATSDRQATNYWLDRGRLTAAPGLPIPDDSDPHSHEP